MDLEHRGRSGLEFDLNDTAEEEEMQSEEVVCNVRQGGDQIRNVVDEDSNRQTTGDMSGASGRMCKRFQHDGRTESYVTVNVIV